MKLDIFICSLVTSVLMLIVPAFTEQAIEIQIVTPDILSQFTVTLIKSTLITLAPIL